MESLACEQCGADVAYVPGSKGLTCNYCGHVMTFDFPEASEKAKNELDLNAYLENIDAQTEQIQVNLVKCQSCGAETEFDPHKTSDACPFCDSPIVVEQAKRKKIIQPQGLLPFKIAQKQAVKNFKQWLGKLWFAPNALKKQVTQHDKFKGIYLPFWTYDCDTHSGYIGQRGIYYYVNVPGRDKNGNPTTRRVRRTRWTPVSGHVSCAFDDVLVPATKSLPKEKLNKLEPWDLHNLVDYKDDYLRGFVTEAYQINLKSGYRLAKKIMDKRIRDRIRSDIGGDQQRIASVTTGYTNASFKHLLLPVWVSAFHYKNKLYQILVNARTGEVQGQRPWSWVKIGFAAAAVAIVIGVIIYFVEFANRPM